MKDFTYYADAKGWIRSVSAQLGDRPTGIHLPDLAGIQDIDPDVLDDAIDAKYGLLQGEVLTSRKRLQHLDRYKEVNIGI